jgi:hypothetical protein
MESLLKNNKDFTSHRGLGALFNSDSLPKTAQLVQDLLLQYPNYPRWG